MGGTDRGLNFVDGCVRTYGTATRQLMTVWENVTGEPMETLSGYPKDRFQKALSYFVRAMERGDATALRKGLEKTVPDGDAKDLIDDSLANPEEAQAPDVDDVPPSVIKKAIWAEAEDRADDEVVDVDLDDFLRGVVKRVMEDMGWKRRFNVGENRHFPRMVQWLREVEEETTWEDGTGLHLMNRSSTGKVATYPSGPHTLKVRIVPEFL